MSLAWLLFTRSLKHSWKRLLLVVLAVSIGVLILFLFTAGYNGLNHRMNHTSWRQVVSQTVMTPQQATSSDQPLYAILSSGSNVDTFWRDTPIDITKLAASGADSPHFDGLPTPAANEYYVSPGLKKIMEEHPEDAVGDRFGTKLLGLIPDRYVTSPDELLVIRGMDLSEAKQFEKTGASIAKIYTINKTSPTPPVYTMVLMLVLYLGIFVLLFPIMILISVATQLGGSQREQRYAALRLVGATKAQVRRVMMVESLTASIVGIGIGFLLYIAARPLVLGFKFQDMRFWPYEVTVPLVEVIAIIFVTLAFTTVINWWAIRRIQMSPLGVVQRSKRHGRPHWWRLIPLLLGLGILGAAFLPIFDKNQQNMTALIIIASVIVLMFGLVIAGSFITRKLAELVARYTKHAEVLLGMKYISLNSRSVFRSVSGVVVALFAGSFLLACTSGLQNLLTQSVADNGYSRLRSDSVLIGSYPMSDPLPDKQADTLRDLSYIHEAIEIKEVGYSVAVMSCHVATQYTSIQCPTDKEYVGVNFNKLDLSKELYGTTEADIYRQISDSSPYFNTSVVIPNYLVRVKHDNIDKLRSFISKHYMQDGSVRVSLFDGVTARKPNIDPLIKEFAELAYIGIGITVLVAAVSLAISTVGGLLERRHSLVTLRLGGMSVGSLKRVVIIESLVPLLSATIISSAFGLAAGFVLMGKLTTTVHSVLSASYILLFGGCIFLALATILCILPSVRIIAAPDRSQTG